jgi:phage terminase small subunit
MHPRHERFVAEYARDWNASAAYQRAGYRAWGHSAAVNASRLLKRPDIAAAVHALMEAHSQARREGMDRLAAMRRFPDAATRPSHEASLRRRRGLMANWKQT